MTYRELLNLYRQGKLEEEKRAKVEADIERQEAIGEYLFDTDTIPGLEALSEEGQEESGRAENGSEITSMINRSIRRAFVKMGLIVGGAVLAVVLFVLLALPNLVSLFYYNPEREVKTSGFASEGWENTKQIDLDLAVYTELAVPAHPRQYVQTDNRGYGVYDIRIPQTITYNKARVGRDLVGRIEREKLELYQTNYLTPPTNEFGWYQRKSSDLPLREQDEAEQEAYDLGEGAKLVHSVADPDYMQETLEELEEDQPYHAYITFNKMMDYASFRKFCDEYSELSGAVWCAVKTSDDDWTNMGNPGIRDVGFYVGSPSGYSLTWDDETYPWLYLLRQAEEQEDMDERMKEEDFAAQHFISMLSYLADQKQFCRMMGIDGTDFNARAAYIRENGITVYGYYAVMDKEDLLKLAEDERVYVIDALAAD